MSEERDRVRGEIIEALEGYDPKAPIEMPCPHCAVVDKILSIKGLAVVDREAEPPDREPPYNLDERDDVLRSVGYAEAQQDMIKEGWVYEVKDDTPK